MLEVTKNNFKNEKISYKFRKLKKSVKKIIKLS